MRMRRKFIPARRKDDEKIDWVPKTSLGREVLEGKIASIDDVLESGRKILEPEIVDVLLPELAEDVLEVRNTQRMTACGRKMLMRAVAIVGDRAGHVGGGVGKDPETREAIAEALKDAKKHLIKARLGCGSWECGCDGTHSITQQTTGKNSSTTITIKPAPKGVGVVAGQTSKKVLELAGVKDAWSLAKGRTRNTLNVVTATIKALDNLNKLKKGSGVQEEGEEEDEEKDQEEAKQKDEEAKEKDKEEAKEKGSESGAQEQTIKGQEE